MPAKAAIIEQIGERGLLLPELHRARPRGQRSPEVLPGAPAGGAGASAGTAAAGAPNLRVQREASGVADASLDRVVESEHRPRQRHDVHSGRVRDPRRLFDELRA